MTSAGRLFHLAKADFLERARRYSFLVSLGLMVAVAYFFLPDMDASYTTINLDGYRGIYNSAMIGASVAVMAGIYQGLIGFYLVKGAITRDRETGVGQIIATTPISKTFYLFGKWLSNLSVLAAMLIILILAAAGMQLVRGEVTQIEVWPLVAPFLLITLPIWAVVAALAVLFDTVRWLSGGFGNVVFFFVFVISFFPIVLGASGVITAMEEGAVAEVPGHSGGSGCCLRFDGNNQQTFDWEGMVWTAESLILPIALLMVAILIVLLSVPFFRRFDPAYGQPGKGRDRLVNAQQKALAVVGIGHTTTVAEDEISIADTSEVRLTPLPERAIHSRFSAVLASELRMAFKGKPWIWYAVAAGLAVAALFVPLENVYSFLLPAAWVWPLLIWSSLGVREARYQTDQYVFSTPRPLGHQLPATWLAGFIVAAVAGSGVLARLVIEGDGPGVLVWLIGALFIPSLALAFGTWTGTSKGFETVYLLLWYIGPVQQIEQFNFVNIAAASSPPDKTVWVFLIASVILTALSAFGRARLLRR